jgi:hypothetical protein
MGFPQGGAAALCGFADQLLKAAVREIRINNYFADRHKSYLYFTAPQLFNDFVFHPNNY